MCCRDYTFLKIVMIWIQSDGILIFMNRKLFMSLLYLPVYMLFWPQRLENMKRLMRCFCEQQDLILIIIIMIVKMAAILQVWLAPGWQLFTALAVLESKMIFPYLIPVYQHSGNPIVSK